LKLIRWNSNARYLPSAEVDGYFSQTQADSSVFAFRTSHMDVEPHSGGFSLKFVTHGSEHYHFGARTLTLAPGRLLLVNRGETYGSTIRDRDTASIALFCSHAVVTEALHSLRTQHDPLARCEAGHVQPEFLPVAFRVGEGLQRCMAAFAKLIWSRNVEREGVEEPALLLLERAIAENLRLFPARPLSRVARRATRMELLRRVLLAREFIEDRRGRASLDEMADVACLSKYHFLRLFRAVFGVTPVTFARRSRISHAAQAVAAGDSQHTAARRAGYASAQTLSRAAARCAT